MRKRRNVTILSCNNLLMDTTTKHLTALIIFVGSLCKKSMTYNFKDIFSLYLKYQRFLKYNTNLSEFCILKRNYFRCHCCYNFTKSYFTNKKLFFRTSKLYIIIKRLSFSYCCQSKEVQLCSLSFVIMSVYWFFFYVYFLSFIDDCQ